MFTPRRSRSAAAPDHDDHGVHDHDLGLGYDLAVMSRRAALRGLLGAAGIGAVGLTVGCATDSPSGAAASGTSTTTTAGSPAASTTECVEAAPGETAGPYPGDGSNGPNVLIESGVHRSDITSGFGGMTGTAEGVPMRLTMTLQDLASDCAPGAGMAVYV
ncbi:MAG: hypothetical protein ACK4M5_16825, partial [Dietzia cercidiphylli]